MPKDTLVKVLKVLKVKVLVQVKNRISDTNSCLHASSCILFFYLFVSIVILLLFRFLENETTSSSFSFPFRNSISFLAEPSSSDNLEFILTAEKKRIYDE